MTFLEESKSRFLDEMNTLIFYSAYDFRWWKIYCNNHLKLYLTWIEGININFLKQEIEEVWSQDPENAFTQNNYEQLVQRVSVVSYLFVRNRGQKLKELSIILSSLNPVFTFLTSFFLFSVYHPLSQHHNRSHLLPSVQFLFMTFFKTFSNTYSSFVSAFSLYQQTALPLTGKTI